MNREISKHVDCPTLTPKLKDLLTRLVYLPNDLPAPTECIFVFGNRNFSDTADKLRELMDLHVSDLVIISGGTPKFADNQDDTLSESKRIASLLQIPYDSPVKLLLEQTATNTKENVSNSLPLFPQPLHSLTYVCQWYISRRARLSLQKYLPASVKYLQSAIPKKEPDTDFIVTPDNWFETEMSRNRIFAEFLRIKTYGERGDIAYDKTTRDLVEEIDCL